MKNVSTYKRVLSTILVAALLFTLLVPAVSAENGAAKSTAAKKITAAESKALSLTPIDASTLESRKLNKASEETEEQAAYQPTDVVRVSIELNKASTIDAGFAIEGIAANLQAKNYRDALKADQNRMVRKIESILDKTLDVKWNLTLAANIISANVAYGDIEKIAAIDGVSSVFIENRYEPEKTVETDEPNNGSASHMIGSNLVWAAGYTGAGSKVAVIDTGIDVDHLSFSGEALEYALAKNAEAKGMDYEAYVESLDLLTADKIDALKDQLNANVGSGEAAHRSTKIAYGYNYVDNNVSYIDHMQDSQGEHGSHVEGISAANRYVKVGDVFVDALDAVGTQGVAPDAQIVTMKVFGKGGGAYDSDYMVAIEDAIILGCDSANLSLGSGNPGMSFSGSYEDIMNKLVANGTVVSFSAGNSYMWYSTPKNDDMYGYLYLDDNNYQTNGSPGSFTNALTVASVDNVGQTGKPLMFGDLHVFYTETNGYGNKPIATLAGDEVEYILFDNVGADGNGNSLLTPYADAIAGKVVLCSRGTSSFYQKVNAAAAAGAIGCIIYNNQTGTISMNLTGLTTDIPAVSITRADGDAIRAQSEVTADESSGEPLYYTGTFSVSTELEINIPEQMPDTMTVSDFSSWGTPGSLVLKPEILAPGGSIYSVWGANIGESSPTSSHEDYELMSGTSMAAPQINGMAGLLGQYIRENGLTAKTGLSQRQLINSLLMSTAHPVFEDYGDYGVGYWPVIRVGAGLANVADAVNAKSYILMDEGSTILPDTAKDGKVKAELGDDPERTGSYTYSFTINPLDDKDKQFTLQTDIFTQDIAGNAGYGMLADTWTRLLDAELTYEVDGVKYNVVSERDADVNGDGETNAADAQAILDYLTDKLGEEEEFDDEAADADFDGMITSKDAYVILESMTTALITAPAGEATEVKVTVRLSDAYKEYLDYYYTGGAYIEGYTYVIPYSTEEGEITDVTHSIPILAYYGSWTDASMLDRDSVIENAYGIGKLPYLGNSNTNYMTVKDENGASSIYMGNPYTVEDEFPAERLALKSSDQIASFNYLNIRNAATLGFAVQDEDGEVLLAQSSATNKFSAYYYVNGATWQNTSPSTYNVGKTLSSAGVKEGDKVTVGFYALPEYYGIVDAKANGEVATTGSLDNEGFKRALTSAMLGDGAGIKYAVTIDDTAPVVTGAMRDLISGDITVTASDNNYVAYIGILNKTGSKVFAETVPAQTEPGQTVTVPVDLEGQTLPSEVVLLVGDYAGNEVAYKIQLGGEAEDLGGTMIGFVNASTTAAPGSGNRAWQIDADALWYNHSAGTYEGLSVFTQMGVGVLAAEYVDGYVFIAGDDGWLYAGKFEELDSVARVARYDDVTDVIYDMAFNYANKKLYALGEDNVLYKIDLLTGELTEVAEITLGDTTGIANALAIDDGGTFYTASEGSSSYSILYKFRLDGSGGSTPEPQPEIEGDVVYQWDFEEDPDDTDWTFVDSDGDGYNWAYHVNLGVEGDQFTTHSGDNLIYSESYHNNESGSGGTALYPDNWAISPAVSLSEATSATLGVWAIGQDADWAAEHFTLYAGTSDDPSEMTAISSQYVASGTYTEYTGDLSDFAGEDEVYVAIRHHNVTDMFILNVDDVTIYAEGYGVGSNPAQPTRSGEPARITALPAEPAEETEEARLTFSFETLEEFNTWTNVDADGDGNVWYRLTTADNDFEPKDGEAFATSASYNGGVLTPDNWFISPAMDFSAVTAEASLSVWAQAQDAGWAAEKFALYAGTTNDPDEMTMVSGPYTLTAGAQGPKGVAGSWYNYTADLSAYAGEEQVFVAIRHYDCTDQFRMNIDYVQIFADGEVSVTEPVAPPDPPEPEPEEFQEITATAVGDGIGAYNYSNGGGMAWDHSKGVLYFVSNYNSTQDYDHYLWIVDTATGAASRANSAAGTGTSSSNPSARLYGSVRGLFIIPGGGTLIPDADEAIAVSADPAELNMLKGQTVRLNVLVSPWNLEDKGFTLESADPTVVSVNDKGEVTALAVGETTVTATTNASPNLTVEVPVTVTAPPVAELRGIIWDESGKGMASVFNTDDTNNWEGLAKVGALRWGALVGDTVYGSTEDTMYVFDADTYELTTLGAIVSDWIPSDAEELPQDFRDAFAAMGYSVGPVIGATTGGGYLTMLDPVKGSLIYFNLTDTVFGEDPMATIAYVGRGEYDDGDSTDDNAAIYYVLTESGALYAFTLNHAGSVTWKLLGNTGIDLSGVSDVTNEIWASMTYNADAEFLYLSLYNGSDNEAHLYAIDANDPSVSGECGTFNDGVWPVVGLYQYTPATDLTLKVEPASVSIFEGTTAQLNIKVKLGETNKFTVASADETVATVDETGLITGVAKGETTVTVTTVDKNAAGEQLKVEVPVSVDGLVHPEIALTAQITDDDGASFAKLNLEDMTYEKLADAPFDADFGTRAGEIYVAGDASLMTALAYEDLTTPADYDYDTELYAEYPVLDIANFPEYYDTKGNLKSEKTLMVLEAGYLVDPQYSGWKLSSYITDMVAVCYAGETVVETEEETPYYNYLILNAAGELYSMGINFEEGKRTNPEKIFETGITFEDLHDASMTYIEDVEIDAETGEMTGTAGVVIADNTNNCIWFVDFLAEELGLVGTYEASNVTGLVGTYDAQKAQLSAHAEPFDPGPEPTDPGTYPEVNTEIKGLKTRFGFETDPAEDGWTFFDRDNDGYGWALQTGASTAYEGTGALLSESYRSGVGALTPDNFAITPAIDLSESQDAVFSVFAKSTSTAFTGEVFAFYAGTTPDIGEMTKISPDFASVGSWTQYAASLKDFAGQSTVYVAIRHYNCTDIYGLLVDNATVFTDDAEPEPEPEIGLSFSFETAQEVSLWTVVNLDADTKTWGQYTSSDAPDGSKVLYSTYNASAPVDDLAISPALDLSELTAAQLSFWVKRGMSSYLENYAVYVGTTPEFSAMTEIIPETEAPTAWTNVTYDLSDYAGQDGVYVAFRHTAEADQYNIYLDLVEIVDPNAEATGAKPAPAQTANEKKTVPAKISVRDLVTRMASRLACGEARLDRELVPATDEMTNFGEAVNKANGGTNAAKNGKLGNRPSFDLMGLEGEAADNTVTLELTEDVAVNNGLVYVSYDPELLTFVGLESGFMYKSYNDDPENGYVTFAFADSEAVAAGDLLAKLTFSYENGCVDTTVTVFTEELNNNVFYFRTEDVDLYDVTYGEPAWTWNEDYTEAAATFTSLDELTSETVEATVAEPEHADPDCTTAGYDKYTATVEFNGKTYTDVQTVEIEALGHKAITLPAVEPTCTQTGLTEGSKCSVCGEVLVEQEIIEALGHTPEAIPAVAPTCTATGLTEGSRCSVCGEILTAQETVAAKGHAWNAGEIVAAATCTADGVKVFTCTVCGDQRVEAITKTGHQAQNVAAIPATCTASGVTAGTKCAVCGAILSGCEAVPAKGHTIVTIPAVAATCTATGMSEGAKCSVCNEIIVAPKQTPKAAHTITSIPAVAATCTAGGKTEGFKCSVCNEVLVAPQDTEALGHNYGAGEVTTAPTTAAEGVMTYTCARCGDKKTESIAKLNGLGLELFLALLKDVDPALYTDETAAAFETAKAAAEKALTDAKSQAELDQALADLLNAFNALEEKPFLFDDVKDSSAFYFDPVYWAYYHEPQITTGTSDTLFSPDNPVTRGQAMTFLWRAAGEPKATNPANPFEDVKEGAFYYDAVLWAVEKGITTGTSATKFSPNGTCTKGHIITFIWRWLGEPAPTGSNPFLDVEESNFYYTAAIWANENGLVDEATGVTATAFNAKETCTRGQTVTFLYRASAED